MTVPEKLYEILQSPIPTAIELTRHIFASPPSLPLAPLSRPVLLRLQWIKPSADDDDESCLYFNNMIGHGIAGRINELRHEMINAGASSWQICSQEEVEYKVDEECIDDPGGLCEIFARVTVWKIPDEAQPAQANDKLAIILKLESDGPGNLLSAPENLKVEDKIFWRYFDLQDLVTPGLDTRPWFGSVASAAAAVRRTRRPSQQPPGQIDESSVSPERDYWSGYASDSNDSSLLSGSRSNKNTQAYNPDPILDRRIRNTPLYRSKAPSVSSTNSDYSRNARKQAMEGTPLVGKGLGPTDLLARISRTPLYKRAPSVDDIPSPPISGREENIDLPGLLEAAGIVNLPKSSQEAAAGSIRSANIPPMGNVPSQAAAPSARGLHSQNQTSSSKTKQVQDALLESLRATYQLYSLSFSHLSPESHPDLLNPGELFVASAHRVVLEQASKKS